MRGLLLLGALPSRAAAAGAASITVHGNATHPVSPLYLGCHSDSGFAHQPRGFYAQMVVGESFEQNLEGICVRPAISMPTLPPAPTRQLPRHSHPPPPRFPAVR